MNIRESSKLHSHLLWTECPQTSDCSHPDWHWCIYITLLLCQQNTFLKNLTQREPIYRRRLEMSPTLLRSWVKLCLWVPQQQEQSWGLAAPWGPCLCHLPLSLSLCLMCRVGVGALCSQLFHSVSNEKGSGSESQTFSCLSSLLTALGTRAAPPAMLGAHPRRLLVRQQRAPPALAAAWSSPSSSPTAHTQHLWGWLTIKCFKDRRWQF